MPRKSGSDDVLADRLDLLAELALIEQEIAAVDTNCGLSLDSLVVRQRVHKVRTSVLEQLQVLLDGGAVTPTGPIH